MSSARQCAGSAAVAAQGGCGSCRCPSWLSAPLPRTACLSESSTSKKHLPSKTYMDPPAKGESVLGQRALIILNSKNTRFLKTKLQAFQKKWEKNMNIPFHQVNRRDREQKRKAKKQQIMMIKIEEHNFQSQKPT